MAEARYIKVEKTARYFLSGPLDTEYSSVCFALHGYGQLASYFSRHFSQELLNSILFVVPEALSRFYLNGSAGRVGASWMTKEERLKDIEDYCAYLNQLYEELLPAIEKTGSCGLLGFSQGVATACRWLSYSSHPFDYLINYAGMFPPDLNASQAIPAMKNLPVKFLLGTEDEYVTPDKYREQLNIFAEQGYPSELRIFEGSHRIYPRELYRTFRELALV